MRDVGVFDGFRELFELVAKNFGNFGVELLVTELRLLRQRRVNLATHDLLLRERPLQVANNFVLDVSDTLFDEES